MGEFQQTEALTLKHLPQEAYWYYFRAITFAGTNPDMHSKLAYLALEIAWVHNGSIFAANITPCLLRANFDILYWRKVLTFLRRYVQKHVSMFVSNMFFSRGCSQDNNPRRDVWRSQASWDI